ncbi:serine hydrolase domain-containing protein [Acidicapsa ligni]|uniref:serine hydrolase domain-containing protein n=1 Tax=Acidicapsa ligni TaxID=542300 RepID=UPI0021E03BF2|nr:serine hydrolase domain-containing protein [Acidicapsa ligni]
MKKSLLVIIGLTSGLVAAGMTQVQVQAQAVDTIDPVLRGRIDRIASQVLEQRGVPSASIAVVKGGKIVYTHAYGLAHLNPDVKATSEMRYSIGSVSKQFTAAAILILQEQGKLSLDDVVEKYVPGLTRGNEVTIRQILSHTSGYQDYWPEDYLMTPMMKQESAQQILDTWAKKPLDFEPGAKWQYSNTNYVIAGEIVEKVSGQRLMEFLGEHVFHPLGMKSVWDSDETKLTSTDATPYVRAALGPLRPAPKEGRGWMFAAGELAMTPHDLALWDESLIAQTVLKPESYTQMFTEVKLKDGKGSRYGLGVEVTQRDGRRSIEHSGEVTGFVSDNEVLVDDGVAVAVLTNHMAGGAEEIAQLVASTVAGAGAQTEAEKQTLAIYRGLQNGQIDRGLLAPNLNDYFSEQTVGDFKDSLAPLGEPLTFKQMHEELRGGMTLRVFRVVYPGKRLSLSTYTYPDGKLEQFLVSPAD